MLDTAVHLAHDLHRLRRLIVDGEKEHGRVHHPRGLVIERAEELREVARLGGERFEPGGDVKRRPGCFFAPDRRCRRPH